MQLRACREDHPRGLPYARDGFCPTSLAVARAADAGLTLVALARQDSALVVCDDRGLIA
ncbi:hypothetical protein [Sphingomonas fennica]|jgi:hypothetical protein|uniref:hypothetical protein n=1 Tax=Edaphosphingomonas fennica TaxID=114404 RepID=UPI001FE4498D|nr:hypothetical protein [Sphingomonas fennica]